MSSKECECPVCGRFFPPTNIEAHVNKCIFLNTVETTPKRKRGPSPTLGAKAGPSSRNSSSNSQQSVASASDLEDSDLKRAKNCQDSRNLSSPTLLSKTGPGVKKLESYREKVAADTGAVSRVEGSGGSRPKSCQNSSDLVLNTGGLDFIVPLASQVQPRSIEEFVGQSHVLGSESMLRALLGRGEIPNMVLWGPPGCGKTSLAGVVKGVCKSSPGKWRFVSLCAATSGVKEVQNVASIARNDLKFGRRTVLFMDEIHRFNKRQQDTFLLCVEKGELILIGATTENPSFVINNALLSRCRVVVFEKLDSEALGSILVRAVKKLDVGLVEDDNPYTYDSQKPITKLSIEKSALSWLADVSDGDARIALTNLQLVLQHNKDNNHLITIEDIKEGIKKSHILYDRKGEEHYNLISALHKSIRGSAPSASLYWLARILAGGEDPLFVARRLVRAASEDIGNADPGALPLAVSTMQGCQLLGMPECDVLLGQCVIYLARAPKSREADEALAKAKRLVADEKERGAQPGVPLNLRNAPTKLMKDLGYGKWDENSTFLPEGYEDINFF